MRIITELNSKFNYELKNQDFFKARRKNTPKITILNDPDFQT